MAYEIKVDLIADLPETGYRNGVGAWEGVCIHDTECEGDSDESEVAYFKANWRTRQAFVHVFTDGDSITQTAKWDYRSWGCGNGNSRFINIEMCSASSQSDFEQLYARTIWLAADRLYEKKLDVIDGKTIVSHDWVAKNLGGTTHSDPISYLKKWGKTWEQLVADVKTVYDSLASSSGSSTVTTERECNIAIGETVVGKGFSLDGKTYCPVRVVSESLGATVGWDSANKKAIINGTVIDGTIVKGTDSYVWSVDIANTIGVKLEWVSSTQTIHYYKS